MRRAGLRRGRVRRATGASAAEGGGPAVRRYQMRERMLSIGDDFTIQTGLGQAAFRVDGKALRLRSTLLLKDLSGNVVYKIQARVARIRDSMTIEGDGNVAARVHKAVVTPLRDRFHIEVPGEQDLKTQGNVLQHEYRITRDGAAVATISKRWFRVRDTYGVEVSPGEDDLLVLAITVCIDQLSQKGR